MNSKTINYAVIFITGAITLSVELLSSNISNYNSILILSFLLLIISGLHYLKKKENKLVLILIFLVIVLQT